MLAPAAPTSRRRPASARSRALPALLLLLASAGPSWARAEPPPAPAAAPSAQAASAPAAIPLTAIIRSAEEAHRTAQRITAQLDAGDEVASLGDRLAPVATAVERALDGSGPLADLDARALVDLRQVLLRNEELLAGWDDRLEQATAELAARAAELSALEATWTLTAQAAGAEGTPGPLQARIASTRTQLAAVRARVRERLDAELAVQDRVASLRLRISDQLARADRIERTLAVQLFEIESVPLWTQLARPGRQSTLADQVAHSASFHGSNLRSYVTAEWAWLVALALAFAALAAAAKSAGRRLPGSGPERQAWSAPAEVLAHPYSAALLLTLAAALQLLPRPPMVVAGIILLGMLAAFLAAMGRLLPPRARRSIEVLALAAAIQSVGNLAPEHSLLGRLILLAVGGISLLALGRGLRRPAWAGDLPAAWRRPVLGGLWAGAGALVVALGANVIGNVTLARLLTGATLVSVALAVLLSGIERVVSALLLAALRSQAAQRIQLMARHADLFSARASRALRWLAVAFWAVVTLVAFGVGPVVVGAAGRVLGYRVQIGSLDLTPGDLLTFGVTLWLSVLLSRFLAFALEEGLDGRGLPRGVPAAISRTAQYAVVALGAVFAVLASGIETTRFTVLLGTLGVGIGFGLQNVVNNFVSGLILIYERPVQVGDVVELGTTTGTVRRIGIRSSTLQTFQGAEVIVPNGDLVSNQVVNWTLSDRIRRLEIEVGVAYGTDPGQVCRLLLGVAGAHPGALASPAPVALFTGFGDSALNFQLRVWTDQWDGWPVVASEVRVGIARALAEAGIAIPFPQRDLHLVSVDEAAARRLAPPAPPAPPGAG